MERKVSNSVYIDTDSLISDLNDEAVQALVCQICLGIVYHPVECVDCQTLFCQKEIKDLKDVCPLCRGNKWKQTENIHRSYKSKLLGLTLKCPSTECPENKEKLSYEKYIKHIESCELAKWKDKPQQDLSKLKNPLGLMPELGDKKFYQFLYADGLAHKPYGILDNICLNLHFQAKTKVFDLGKYTINLEAKQQMNKITKNIRQLRIDQVEHKPQYWWYTSIENNMFSPYEEKLQKSIENSYLLYLKNKKPTQHHIRLLNRQYTIDFEKMQQFNSHTKTSRAVFRVLL